MGRARARPRPKPARAVPSVLPIPSAPLPPPAPPPSPTHSARRPLPRFPQKRLGDQFPVGTCLALLEPYLKRSGGLPGGRAMLRCDNPQSALRFRSERQWRQAAEGRPAAPGLGNCPDGPRAAVEDARALARDGRFADAAEAYGDALVALAEAEAGHAPVDAGADPVTCPEVWAARAECHLRVGHARGALADCEAVLRDDPGHAAALHLRSWALLLLQRPADALALGAPEDEGLRRDLEAAVAEQRGDYPFARLRREAAATDGRVSRVHADFVSPALAVGAEVAGKGRGVRATEGLREGQLLMASRAFVRHVKGPARHQQDPLVAKVVARLMADPALATEVYALDAGAAYRDVPAPETPTAVVDVERLLRLCQVRGTGQRSLCVWGGMCGDWQCRRAVRGRAAMGGSGFLKGGVSPNGTPFREPPDWGIVRTCTTSAFLRAFLSAFFGVSDGSPVQWLQPRRRCDPPAPRAAPAALCYGARPL